MTYYKNLKELSDTTESKLEKFVCEYVLDYADQNKENVKYFFNDLMQGGCSSGFIGDLIYYKDTHNFFDRFYDEIEELRKEYQQETGCELHPLGDLKNWFAWFSFEETAFRIAGKIGLEI